MLIRHLFLLLVLSASLVHVSSAQDANRFFKWMYSDVIHLLRGIDKATLGYTAGSIGGIALLSVLDEPIDDAFTGNPAPYFDFFNHAGEPEIMIPVSLGLFGVTLFSDNTHLQDAAFTSMQSLAYASVATLAIKYTLGRHRPHSSNSPLSFSPFTNHDSFPSGHVTAITALLVPWAMYYPSAYIWGTVATVGVSTMVARMSADKHWFTDTLSGAAIGSVTGWLLSRRHLSAPPSSSFSIKPALSPNQLQLVVRF